MLYDYDYTEYNPESLRTFTNSCYDCGSAIKIPRILKDNQIPYIDLPENVTEVHDVIFECEGADYPLPTSMCRKSKAFVINKRCSKCKHGKHVCTAQVDPAFVQKTKFSANMKVYHELFGCNLPKRGRPSKYITLYRGYCCCDNFIAKDDNHGEENG